MTLTIGQRAALVRGGKMLAFAAAVWVATKLTLACAALTGAPAAAFSFLIIVLLSAYLGDLSVAVVTSVVAALCFDYFYLPPAGTLHVTAASDWMSLAAFLAASLLISRLTAAAAQHAARERALGQALAGLKELGAWLVATPHDALTLSGIAQAAVRAFALEYCSIHVYGDGRWQHHTGAAASRIPPEVEERLQCLQDHEAGVLELAEESLLGVRYVVIRQGNQPLAILAVKSKALPGDALEAVAFMIGTRLAAASGAGPSAPRDERR